MTDTKTGAAGFLARIAKVNEELEERRRRGEMLEFDDVDLEPYLPRRPKPKGRVDDEQRQRAESALPRGDRTE